jgi:hypothetical protein
MALTQPEAASAPVRAALGCNRIQLDATRNRANQPGFLFGDFFSALQWGVGLSPERS